jgi:prepilin-type processing-associated H-X9-DG protein
MDAMQAGAEDTTDRDWETVLADLPVELAPDVTVVRRDTRIRRYVVNVGYVDGSVATTSEADRCQA